MVITDGNKDWWATAGGEAGSETAAVPPPPPLPLPPPPHCINFILRCLPNALEGKDLSGARRR